MKTELRRFVLNLSLFQAGWFAFVVGGDRIALWLLPLLLIFHHYWVLQLTREWSFVVGFSVLGVSIDSLLSVTGLLFFEEQYFFIPFWLFALWLMMATTFHHCLSWLVDRYYLAAALGAFFSTLAYWAGANLSRVTFHAEPWRSLLAIAVVWALLLPLGLHCSQRYFKSQEVSSKE
ncbi:MAG: hypothetical protein ACI89Z_000772 [Porticoccus sp.]|jgi:hypothetical protein